MAKSHELKKKAEAKYRDIKDLYSKETLTAEDNAKFDEWNKEFDSLMDQARKFEEFEKKEIEQAEDIKEAEKTLKRGDKVLTPEARKEREVFALKEYLFTGRVAPDLHDIMSPVKAERDDDTYLNTERKRLGLQVRAAQQSTSDGSGGYTIPQGFQKELEIAMQAFGGMLEVCRIWPTDSGNVIDWPKVNDTMNRGYLLSEAGNAETSAVNVTDANQQFEAYKATSGMLRLSYELIQDSAFNIVEVINGFLRERIARAINYHTTLSDGSSKPKGITIAAAHGNNTADDAALAANDFLNLEHEVDPAYRRGARWMFHDSVLKAIKKLSVADTTVYPLWLPSFRDGQPSSILGYPYTINQDMAAFTDGSASANDNAKIALFGDFSKYIIRRAGDIRLVRLNERFGDTDEIGVAAFVRFDGDLLDAGTHPVKYMRVSAT